MDYKKYIQITDRDLKRFEGLYQRYKTLYTNPDDCTPMVIINAPVPNLPTWEECLADPFVMLGSSLDILRSHLEMEDDHVPIVRVEFGTVQVAAAFGCDIFIPTNNLPAVRTHILTHSDDVFWLVKPNLTSGLYGKLEQWTELWLDNLPKGIHIQHPDIQSPFNNAHLIRGNDILTDFFDNPAAVERLLEVVTDYMIDVTRHLKAMISSDNEWFFDYGALWKGSARISNCSMHMISPKFYKNFVLPRDTRFFNEIGGGRVHYCGTSDKVIDYFFKIPGISGLDYDANFHDLWSLSERAPKNLILYHSASSSSPSIQRLLKGDFPHKRNIILAISTNSIDEGKQILKQLRKYTG